MIKNYFNLVIRTLARNKLFSFINILGFTLGLTGSIIIFVIVAHELSFDKHLRNYEQIYRVVKEEQNDHTTEYEASPTFPLGKALQESWPLPEKISRIYVEENPEICRDNEIVRLDNVTLADSNFIDLWDVKVLRGNLAKIKEPNQAFLTETAARKIFGDEDPMGRELIMRSLLTFTVAGILEDPPQPTNLTLHMLGSLSTIKGHSLMPGFHHEHWGTEMSGFATLLKMPKTFDESAAEKTITDIYYENRRQDSLQTFTSYKLQPLSKIHINDRYDHLGTSYQVSPTFILIFISAGLFLLVIAIINFINLSTVQALRRAKEVGIRKTLGAGRARLIRQFMGETFFIVLISVALSLILTEIALPVVNRMMPPSVVLDLYRTGSVFIFLGIILFIVVLLSGSYPAFVLSRYNPMRNLQAQKLQANGKKKVPLQTILVFSQFLISQVLIIATLIIGLQVGYLSNKKLGFRTDHILSVHLPMGEQDRAATLRERLLAHPEIADVTLSMAQPTSNNTMTSNYSFRGQDDQKYANIKISDATYAQLYQLEPIAGRWIKETAPSDTLYEVVVNEALLKARPFATPEEAIGTYLDIWSHTYKIVGVVKNFHNSNLRNEISPVIFLDVPMFYMQAGIHYQSQDPKELTQDIGKIWEELYPEFLFDYTFYDQYINRMYHSEARTLNTLKIFTGLAIIIACLGLLGLLSHIILQRTKEIGIRKALGASVNSIIRILSRRFIGIILLSSLVAWPLSYLLMNRWLQDFAYRIELSWWMFLSATLSILLVALLFIFLQARKAAQTNPALTLRDE
jgi:ABC-type antimicrobial peptide transport system permease subunit